MNQKFIFMSLGHPGSGKTYFTTHLSQKLGVTRLNADALRAYMFGSHDAARAFDKETGLLGKVIFEAIDYAAVQVLKSGNSVIYDIQQNERVIRNKTSKLGTDNDALPVIVWVKTPVDIALQRGQDREHTPDQQKHDYDRMKALIDRHIGLLEQPTDDENVITIDGTIPFDEQFVSFQDQLKAILLKQAKII